MSGGPRGRSPVRIASRTRQSVARSTVLCLWRDRPDLSDRVEPGTPLGLRYEHARHRNGARGLYGGPRRGWRLDGTTGGHHCATPPLVRCDGDPDRAVCMGLSCLAPCDDAHLHRSGPRGMVDGAAAISSCRRGTPAAHGMYGRDASVAREVCDGAA